MEYENAFHQLMKSFWHCMDKELPYGQSSDVYTVAFDNQVEVHFLSTQEGRLDIIAEAGFLVNKQAGQPLLNLLALNHPPFNVNVDQETGAVLVWTRQELAGTDRERLIELVSQMMTRVQQAKVCIECRETRRVLLPALPHHRMYPLGEGEKRTDTGLRS